MRRIIILSLIGLVFGCAHDPQLDWVRPNATKKELKKDSFACAKDADSSVSEKFGMIIPVAIYNDYYDRCMMNKGYIKQK